MIIDKLQYLTTNKEKLLEAVAQMAEDDPDWEYKVVGPLGERQMYRLDIFDEEGVKIN